jgi:hypothetical protein
MSSENERHAAWELNIDGKALATATFQEGNPTAVELLEAILSRSRARAFSDRKSNRKRSTSISPNATPTDVPEQSESHREPDRVAQKSYLTGYQMISSHLSIYLLTPCLFALIMT